MKTASTLKEHCEALQRQVWLHQENIKQLEAEVLKLEQRLHEVADDRKKIKARLKTYQDIYGNDLSYGKHE